MCLSVVIDGVCLSSNKRITYLLTYLFQKSFSDSCSPDDWKTANVVPLFKKGSKTNPDNYRHVSLTCVACKIMGSVIRDYVAEKMMNSGFLSAFQHGFLKASLDTSCGYHADSFA